MLSFMDPFPPHEVEDLPSVWLRTGEACPGGGLTWADYTPNGEADLEAEDVRLNQAIAVLVSSW